MRIINPSYKILVLPPRETIFPTIELIGKVCYKSEAKITPGSAPQFINGLIARGHESVIEHSYMTVNFVCDRGVSHELVRHRLASFSQESTRYCKYKDHVTFVVPPWISFPCGNKEFDSYKLLCGAPEYVSVEDGTAENMWLIAMAQAERVYQKLLDKGWTAQMARDVLPHSLKTEVNVTANMREWRHILKQRASKYAHPQMQEIMLPLLEELCGILPELFLDVKRDIERD